MKILVTGGAGYVGGHLVDQLILDGNEVHVVDSLFYEDQFLKPVKFAYGDIRDTQLMTKLS
jgi:nucleoside-diphosphate-sugar epimerase